MNFKYRDCRQMLTYGRRIPLTEFDYRIQQVDAKTVREVCTRYIYDKCPAIVGIGMYMCVCVCVCVCACACARVRVRACLHVCVCMSACTLFLTADHTSYILVTKNSTHFFPFAGPIEQLPDYNRIRGNMYWARS